MVIRFLDTRKTNLRWLLTGAFIQTGAAIDGRIRHLLKTKHEFLKYNLRFPSTPNHTKNNLVSSS